MPPPGVVVTTLPVTVPPSSQPVRENDQDQRCSVGFVIGMVTVPVLKLPPGIMVVIDAALIGMRPASENAAVAARVRSFGDFMALRMFAIRWF